MKVDKRLDPIPTVDIVDQLIQRFMYSNALDFLTDSQVKALSAYMYQEKKLRGLDED